MRQIAELHDAAAANGIAQQGNQSFIDSGARAGARRVTFGAHQRFEFGIQVRFGMRMGEGAQLLLEILQTGGTIRLSRVFQPFGSRRQFRQLLRRDANERRQPPRPQPPVLVQILCDDLFQTEQLIHRIAQTLRRATAYSQAFPDLPDGDATTRRLHESGKLDNVDGAFVHGVSVAQVLGSVRMMKARDLPSTVRDALVLLAESSDRASPAVFAGREDEFKLLDLAVAHAFAGGDDGWTPIENIVRALEASDDFGRPVDEETATTVIEELCASGYVEQGMGVFRPVLPSLTSHFEEMQRDAPPSSKAVRSLIL